MKQLLNATTLLTALLCCQLSFAQLTSPPSGWSQKSEVSQWIGLAKVTINYSSPDVTDNAGNSRDGQIWGKLVPYGLNNLGFGTSQSAPWRAGANENTIFTVSHDVNIEGKKLKAGTYGLHMIARPEGEKWTVIFSHNSGAWGSFFYDASEDALRVEVMPKKNEFTEWLTYEFIDRKKDHAVASLQWERILVPFKIEVENLTDMYVSTMRQELQSSPGFSWQSWVTATNYCVQNQTNLEEALAWSDQAISAPFVGQKNFTTLQAKASVLMAMKKQDEAMGIMDEAINHASAVPGQIHVYGRQLLTMGMKEKAMEVFKKNAEKNPGVWPVNVGLTRGYSAMGEYKKAIKHAKLALENVPQGDNINGPSLEAMIEKLSKGEDVN
ncbi:MAG: DUF2911 domain-containing protein [Bacteroidota bacterium]